MKKKIKEFKDKIDKVNFGNVSFVKEELNKLKMILKTLNIYFI
ncbi:hypothetical protein [Borreliella japonica]